MTGLFQSEKQIRDAQFAADAATGAQGINGIMGMIGGDVGRALGGNVDPRILLAKEFEGKDLNKPEDLMQLMGSANNLGLQAEAIKIADRIRTVTPKAKEGFTLADGAMRFDAAGNIVASNEKTEKAKDTFQGMSVLQKFTNEAGQQMVAVGNRNTSGGADANVRIISADEWNNISKGGSGTPPSQRHRGHEPEELTSGYKQLEGFRDLGKEDMTALGSIVAPAISALNNIAGLEAPAANTIIANEIEKTALSSNEWLPDFGDPNNISFAETQKTIERIQVTEGRIAALSKKLGGKYTREQILKRLIGRGEIPEGYGEKVKKK